MTNERPFHEQYEVRASNGNQVLEDLTAASARIAELEDWQRRAVDELRSPCPRCRDHEDYCPQCLRINALLREVRT